MKFCHVLLGSVMALGISSRVPAQSQAPIILGCPLDANGKCLPYCDQPNDGTCQLRVNPSDQVVIRGAQSTPNQTTVNFDGKTTAQTLSPGDCNENTYGSIYRDSDGKNLVCGADGKWLNIPTAGTSKYTAGAKPLKCGKYQHVEHWPGTCGPSPCEGTWCASVCSAPPPDKCVDDMHEVTEREWQELMQRLASLERVWPNVNVGRKDK